MDRGGGFEIALSIVGLLLLAMLLGRIGEWLIGGWRDMRADDEPPPGRSPDWVKGSDDEGTGG